MQPSTNSTRAWVGKSLASATPGSNKPNPTLSALGILRMLAPPARTRSARHLVDGARRRRNDIPLCAAFLNPPADPEHMPIRMAHVHLARVPRHVGRRPGDF